MIVCQFPEEDSSNLSRFIGNRIEVLLKSYHVAVVVSDSDSIVDHFVIFHYLEHCVRSHLVLIALHQQGFRTLRKGKVVVKITNIFPMEGSHLRSPRSQFLTLPPHFCVINYFCVFMFLSIKRFFNCTRKLRFSLILTVKSEPRSGKICLILHYFQILRLHSVLSVC